MVEKIGTIRNPLTIIAIFAAIAEISGTMVLPFVAEANQGTYIWFLMIFPILLVVLFFATLNFNHRVLYAPSDFKNEDNFFKAIRNATPAEAAEKIQEEVEEIEAQSPESVKSAQTFSGAVVTPSPNDVHTVYLLSEKLVLDRLSQELDKPIQHDVRIGTVNHYILDGVI